MAGNFPARGPWIEELPKETFESQTEGEDALAAIKSFLLGREQRRGEQIAQLLLQLAEGGLTNRLSAAPTEGGESGTQGWEEGSEHRFIERYIYRSIDVVCYALYS